MKKAIAVLLLLLTSSFTFSQTYKSDAGLINLNIGNKFEEAEITYTDDTRVKGFINGFIENNSIEIGTNNNFGKLEEQLNLADKKFYFKKDLNDKATVLTQANIKNVSVVVNNVKKTYYLMKIKTVDKNKKIVDLNRKAWLPLLKDDAKIKIFGFNLFMNNRYVHTYAYLSKDGEYALKPSDNIFIGMDSMIESYQTMLKYIFDDCENIKPLIVEFTNKEKAKKSYAELQSKIKDLKKNKSLTKTEESYKVLMLNEEYFTEAYVKMITEYNRSCR